MQSNASDSIDEKVIKVYKVLKFSIPASGKHSINRDESWSIALMQTFSSMEEAKEFVREKHRHSVEFILLTELLSESEKQKFLNVFSFDDETYITQRTYFIDISRRNVQARLVDRLKQEQIDVRIM